MSSNLDSGTVSAKELVILCLGDVVARPGREGIRRALPALKQKFGVDVAIVNGENASGGLGLDVKSAHELKNAGADVITLGDHTWKFKELRELLDRDGQWCIRPHNFPAGASGLGFTTLERGGLKIGVINLIGRVYSSLLLDCPFRSVERILEDPGMRECSVIICDMHCDATSEKIAMGRFLDGRVSLVFGTHTHVQTADQQILPGGTAYITDLGMCGCASGVIGMDGEVALERFYTGLPCAYRAAADEKVTLSGVLVRVDSASGRAISIERVSQIVELGSRVGE